MDRRPAPAAAGVIGLRVGPDLALGRPVAARSNIRRDAGLDALRASLTLLVLFYHASITYGASGDRYCTEVQAGHDPSSLLLSLFTGFNQVFFMGLFFLPRAVERHGAAAYMGERALRLGLPLLIYFPLLSPAAMALAATARGRNFFTALVANWTQWRMESGPLWFCEALLIFAGLYLALRALAPGLARLVPRRLSHRTRRSRSRRSARAQPLSCCASSGRREQRLFICNSAISPAMSCCSRPDASGRPGRASTRRRRRSGACGS
jgi:Acyltransferase family